MQGLTLLLLVCILGDLLCYISPGAARMNTPLLPSHDCCVVNAYKYYFCLDLTVLIFISSPLFFHLRSIFTLCHLKVCAICRHTMCYTFVPLLNAFIWVSMENWKDEVLHNPSVA